MVVDAVSNEKGVDKEVIFEALEAALASATRKKHGEEWDARVSIDRKSGDYDTFRRWKVFADDSKELEVPEHELRLEDAVELDPQAQVGGYVEQPVESVAFGRIAAQQAKQGIVQKVREAGRAQVVGAYRDRVGTLVSGVVKRVDRNGIYIDLGGNAEGFVPRTDMIPREQAKPQDRIKAFLKEVRSEPRGPQLFLTRTAPEFLIELFKLEGWDLNVMTESDAEVKSETESKELVQNFMKQLDVDEDVATILAQEGFSTIEEIAYVPQAELAAIQEFDVDIVKELRNRARDV